MAYAVASGGLAELLGAQQKQQGHVDTVFIGLYADRAAVDHHLRAGEVTFADGRIRTGSAPPLRQVESGIALLDSRAGRNVLVVLAASEGEVRRMVALLATGAYRSGLVSPTLGLYDFS